MYFLPAINSRSGSPGPPQAPPRASDGCIFCLYVPKQSTRPHIPKQRGVAQPAQGRLLCFGWGGGGEGGLRRSVSVGRGGGRFGCGGREGFERDVLAGRTPGACHGDGGKQAGSLPARSDGQRMIAPSTSLFRSPADNLTHCTVGSKPAPCPRARAQVHARARARAHGVVCLRLRARVRNISAAPCARCARARAQCQRR